MSELPQGWGEARIGDFLSALLDFRGRTPKKLGMEWGGSIPALSAQNVRQGKIDLERTPHFGSDELYERWMNQGDPEQGDIVLTMEAPMGNVAQIPDERRYILSQRVVLLKTMRCIDNSFLSHQLRADKFRSHLLSNATGTTAAGISQARLVEVPVLIAPLPEQKRIADKLDALLAHVDAACTRLDKVPVLLKRFRQSVLAAATSGELTEGWREGQDENKWEETSLVEICEKDRVITYGVIKLGNEDRNGVQCLRTSNVRWLNVDVSGLKRIDKDLSDSYARTILRGGEVLVNVRGTLGGVASVDQSMIGWNVSREIAVVPVCSKQADARFIALYVASEKSQKWLTSVQKGVAYTGINIEDLRSLPITLPPFDEQVAIVQRVESMFAFADRVQVQYEAARARVNKLTSSLLAKAFRGELVPQNPNDEPVSVLLERLRATQGGAKSASKRGRKARAT